MISPDDLDCECVLAGDTADARDCPLHGPDGEITRWMRQRAAEDEAAYWRHFEMGDEG